jgi:hypothetical protein
VNRGCESAACFEREEWRNWQFCSNYCSSGRCILPPGVVTRGVVITY